MKRFGVFYVCLLSLILHTISLKGQLTNKCSSGSLENCGSISRSLGRYLGDNFASIGKNIAELQQRLDQLSCQCNPRLVRWLVEKQGIHPMVDTGDVILKTCKAYIDTNTAKEDGWYFLETTDNNIAPVYCDQTTLGGGWMRLIYKEGSSTCYSNQNIHWTAAIMTDLDVEDFAVSDNSLTLNREKSWILLGFTNRTSDNGMTFLDGLANLGNCLTPTGTPWSQSYTGGYIYFFGRLATMGSWTTMHSGCYNTVDVGDDIGFRSGGGMSHSGEFIHSSCNDYHLDTNNAITSRWNDNNGRSIWFR